MTLGVLYKGRRVSAMLALIGMAFYAMLFPWHTVSQTSMLLAQAGLATSTIPICHRDAAPISNPAKPEQPAKQTHCPICNGFAALQFALAGAPISLVLPPRPSGKLSFGTEDHLADALVQAAQSRGPPPHSV